MPKKKIDKAAVTSYQIWQEPSIDTISDGISIGGIDGSGDVLPVSTDYAVPHQPEVPQSGTPHYKRQNLGSQWGLL